LAATIYTKHQLVDAVAFYGIGTFFDNLVTTCLIHLTE